MKIDRNKTRLLLSDGNGGYKTAPSGVVMSSTSPKRPQNSASPSAVVGLKATQHLATSIVSDKEPNIGLETAANGLPPGSTTSNQGARDLYAPLLQGYMDLENSQDVQGNRRETTISLNYVYRDLYASDPICGSAVDLMSNMPFSDFTLGGAKDSKYLVPFATSIDNMNMQSLFPVLSTEYLVHGMFCATTLWDDVEKVYTGIVPQNVDFVETTPMPLFGEDPLITLRIGDAIKLLKDSTDPRVKQYLDHLPKDSNSKDGYRPDPKNVLYIIRSNLTRDIRGVSIYRRILPTWLIEKAMYRGTLDQAIKRQRSIAHLIAGDDEWEPTTAEMETLASMLMAADLDPVGAVFVTRNGVSVNEIRSGEAFWKVSDMEMYFTQVKLRALGVSETFLSGEGTFNSLDQVLSVYVEQMRAYREKVTDEVFYNRMFPRISTANNLTNKRNGLGMVRASEDPNQLQMFSEEDLMEGKSFGAGSMPFFEGAAELDYRRTKLKYQDLLIPQVLWHKRLRPEADQAYLDMLTALSEKGVPIPIRMWASAGGLDLKSLVNQQEEDINLRDSLTDWLKAIGKSASAATPGGDGGGGEFASLATSGFTKKVPILNRGSEKLMEQYGARNTNSVGDRRLLSSKGAKQMEERINKTIAEAAASVAAKTNRLETRLEEMQRDYYGRVSYSYDK